VERYINQYIQNLPDANTDPEALELDSTAVLKAIEAQHGLLVERARGIYSFSHLTFHEYFTARKIVMSCNPYAADDPMLQGLVSHLTEKRRWEVFLLTVGMLDSADVLLRLMKTRIEELLAEDEKLQEFLRWVDEKARSVQLSHNVIAIRAFYFSHTLALDLNRAWLLPQTLAVNSNLGINLNQSLVIALDIGMNIDRSLIMVLDPLFGIESHALTFDLDLDQNGRLEFQRVLEDLANQIPKLGNHILFRQWWQFNGKTWTEQLRAEMIKYRNIGHDWQFNGEQKERLQQYYYANKLLVDCLNSDCYVSREVRQDIEETLLLPIAEIEKRSGL
jgi:predicted NACHT family NTPase